MTLISGIWLQDRAEELKASIAFCTRLPLPRATPQAAEALVKAAWAFPVAGLIVGLIGAAVYVLAHRLGVPAWPAAALSVVATLVVTGALHEDGLADVADAFGAGEGRERALEILKDPHHGTYGVLSLVLGTLALVNAHGGVRIAAMAVFAVSVSAMFGASALYHRVPWSARGLRWMKRLDHSMIFLLIAGTYTPFGLLVLHGLWQWIVLCLVWGGAAAGRSIWVKRATATKRRSTLESFSRASAGLTAATASSNASAHRAR